MNVRLQKLLMNISQILRKKVQNTIPKRKSKFTDKLPTLCPHSIFLNPVDSQEVNSIINKLKPKTSSGKDNVSSKLLKFVSPCIIDILAHIINISLTNGIFPNEMKTAKVIPIYKSGDKSCLANHDQ